MGFDDCQDAEIIASAKISQLKAKGIHVTRGKPTKKESKQDDGIEEGDVEKQQMNEVDLTAKLSSKKHQRDEQEGNEKNKKKKKKKDIKVKSS